MFGSKKTTPTPETYPQSAQPASRNLIAKGTVIEGTITSEGALRIEGEFIGNLDAKSKVVIGDTGKIKGDIKCESIDIEGKFEGNLNALGMVAFKSTAQVDGDVVYGKFVIEAGAVFNGTCKIQKSNGAPSFSSSDTIGSKNG
ncbi:MAG: polymer-forming cytoskeletal protein [Chitinophagales bacterium]|nr:polymer-forming cytoskeletal protein [Bacteroidota bacterium]